MALSQRPGDACARIPAISAVQPSLPSLGGQRAAEDALRFAHPAEQEVARVFSFFRLRWAYEPTSFTLRRHEDGSIAEMFTPDFFLPDLGIYVELTTMRQSLVTRKNRKARLLRELYPNVRLRLLYRRDVLRLMECYRGEVQRPEGAEILRIVQGEAAIEDAIDRQAMQLLARAQRDRTHGAAAPALVTVSPGSRRLADELLRRFSNAGMLCHDVRLNLDSPALRPRIRATRSQLDVLRRSPVFLVETLISTGLSLGFAQRWLTQRGAAPVMTTALFARSGTRIVGLHLDSVAFKAPNDVLVGFGLNLRPGLAELPYVGAARTSGKLPASVSSTLRPV